MTYISKTIKKRLAIAELFFYFFFFFSYSKSDPVSIGMNIFKT